MTTFNEQFGAMLIKVWGCKSFKAFCELNPTISTDSQYIIKASGKPTVSLTNIQ